MYVKRRFTGILKNKLVQSSRRIEIIQLQKSLEEKWWWFCFSEQYELM